MSRSKNSGRRGYVDQNPLYMPRAAQSKEERKIGMVMCRSAQVSCDYKEVVERMVEGMVGRPCCGLSSGADVVTKEEGLTPSPMRTHHRVTYVFTPKNLRSNVCCCQPVMTIQIFVIYHYQHKRSVSSATLIPRLLLYILRPGRRRKELS